MKDHLVVVFGMMTFFNHCFRGKNVKHYIFESLQTAELIFQYRAIYYLLFRIIIAIPNSCFLHESILQLASNNQTSYRFRVRGVTCSVWQ